MTLWVTLAALAPILVSADTPDVLDLSRRSMQAMEANRPKARQYAYREYKVSVEHDKNGKETDRETQTWDIIGLEGSTFRKLILRNDKALSPKEQKHEDERMEKERRIRQQENADQRKRRLMSLSYSFFFPYHRLVDIYDLKITGEEDVNARHAYVVLATPKVGFQPKTDDEKESTNYTFKLWMAETDGFPIRMEAEVTGEHSRMQKGSRFRMDFLRIDDAWLPRELTVHYYARFMKLLSGRGLTTQTYSDHHKFQVDSKIEFAEPPNK